MNQVTDRGWLRQRLLAAPWLHLYELGDLDEFFWPNTTWYAHGDAIALVYTAAEPPVLLAFGGDEHTALLTELRELLPVGIYAHLSPGFMAILAPRYGNEARGAYAKMALRDPAKFAEIDTSAVQRASEANAAELIAFYAQAYPGNWFDPRMLLTGQYFVLRQSGAIAAAAGVHVYSAHERVAAIGNVAVAPEWRARGLARQVTAALCQSLIKTTTYVGLNVRKDNAAAIACYARLGFEHAADYEEHLLIARE